MVAVSHLLQLQRHEADTGDGQQHQAEGVHSLDKKYKYTIHTFIRMSMISMNV